MKEQAEKVTRLQEKLEEFTAEDQGREMHPVHRGWCLQSQPRGSLHQFPWNLRPGQALVPVVYPAQVGKYRFKSD